MCYLIILSVFLLWCLKVACYRRPDKTSPYKLCCELSQLKKLADSFVVKIVSSFHLYLMVYWKWMSLNGRILTTNREILPCEHLWTLLQSALNTKYGRQSSGAINNNRAVDTRETFKLSLLHSHFVFRCWLLREIFYSPRFICLYAPRSTSIFVGKSNKLASCVIGAA